MYKVNMEDHSMAQVEQICLRDAQLMERYDLQEWIDNNPECLGERLLVIQKEFSAWGGGADRRLDLLMLDQSGKLVIVENKRDDSGREVVAQALTYASFCKTMSARRIVDEFKHYRNSKGEQIDDAAAERLICDFLGVRELVDAHLNETDQRIILVAGQYPVEVTSSVLWLREYGVDVVCVKYSVYCDGDRTYIDFDRIIPIPGMEEYQVRMDERRNEVAMTRNGRANPMYQAYWSQLNEYLRENEIDWFRPNNAAALAGRNYYSVFPADRSYYFDLRLLSRDQAVCVALTMDTRRPESNELYQRLQDVVVRNGLVQAFGGNELEWGENQIRTVVARREWNQDNHDIAIQWQIETMCQVKQYLDGLQQ